MGDNGTRQHYVYLRDDRGRFMSEGKQARVSVRCRRADMQILRDECERRKCTMSALLLGCAKREISAALTADG